MRLRRSRTNQSQHFYKHEIPTGFTKTQKTAGLPFQAAQRRVKYKLMQKLFYNQFVYNVVAVYGNGIKVHTSSITRSIQGYLLVASIHAAAVCV